MGYKMAIKKIIGKIIEKLELGKSVFAFITVIVLSVLSVDFVFHSPLCFAGTKINKVSKANKTNGNGGKTAAGKNSIAYPYYLKRDPFRTFLYTKKPVTSFKVGELPLLQYAVSSLKVVGIMSRRGKYFAMLQTPDNRSYIITVGSLVGVNRARVVSISGDAVNLVERTYNIFGQMRSMNIVMPLK